MEASKQLLDNIGKQYDKCLKLMQEKELQLTLQLHKRSSSTGIDKDQATSTESTSHATNLRSNISKNFSVLKRIKLDRKKAEFQSLKDIAYAKALKAKAIAKAEARSTQAEAEARKAQAEAEEALAKLRLKSANFEAKEKNLAHDSHMGSQFESLCKSKSSSRLRKSSASHQNEKLCQDPKRENETSYGKPALKQSENKDTRIKSLFQDYESRSNLYVSKNVETKPQVPAASK